MGHRLLILKNDLKYEKNPTMDNKKYSSESSSHVSFS